MKRGRKPKSNAQKRRAGNPGRRPLTSARQPAAPTRAPACPSHLDRTAGREWRRVVRELRRIGLVTDLDRGILTAYCETWSLYVAARERVAAEGPVLIGASGRPYDSPSLNQMRGALREMVRYAAELGLTPNARKGLDLTPESEPAGKARLFKISG